MLSVQTNPYFAKPDLHFGFLPTQDKDQISKDLTEVKGLLGTPNVGIVAHQTTLPGEMPVGTPNEKLAIDFLKDARDYWGNKLVFEAPGGITSGGDLCPYLASLFGFNPVSIDLDRLTGKDGDIEEYGHLLNTQDVEALKNAYKNSGINLGETLGRQSYNPSAPYTNYELAYPHYKNLLSHAFKVYKGQIETNPLTFDFNQFKETHQEDWLDKYALYYAFSEEYKDDYYKQWGNKDAIDYFKNNKIVNAETIASILGTTVDSEQSSQFQDKMEEFRFIQFLAHKQQLKTKSVLNGNLANKDIERIGDWQFGQGNVDVWADPDIWLEGYVAGVPPDYFSPTGQYWGFKVPKPDYAQSFMAKKTEQLTQYYDGFRQDHTVGHIDPWVIKENPQGLALSPRNYIKGKYVHNPKAGYGERLYSSPYSKDPYLRKISKIRKEDVNTKVVKKEPNPEKAKRKFVGPEELESWVKLKALTPNIAREYAANIRQMFKVAKDHNVPPDRIFLEDLGTVTHPVQKALQLLEKEGIKQEGGMALTIFTEHDNKSHPWLEDKLIEGDLVAFASHDNAGLLQEMDGVDRNKQIPSMIKGVSRQIFGDDTELNTLANKEFKKNHWAIATGKIAVALASKSKNVLLRPFDIVGDPRTYNAPGTSGPPNWLTRLPQNPMQAWTEAVQRGEGIDLFKSYALALWQTDKGHLEQKGHQDLFKRLVSYSEKLQSSSEAELIKDPLLERMIEKTGS